MSIAIFNNSPVPFNVDNHELYGENLCYGENAKKFCQPIKSGDTTMQQFKPCDFGSDIINNGGFALEFDWILGDGFTINTTLEKATSAGSVITSSISQTVVGLDKASATNPLTYQLKFVINAFEDNATANDLNVKIGGNLIRIISDTTTGGPNQLFLDSITVTSTTNFLLEFEAEAEIDFDLDSVELIVAECAIVQECANPEMVTGVPAWVLGGWTQNSSTISILDSASGILTNPLSAMLDVNSYGRLTVHVQAAPTGTGTCKVRLGGNLVTTFDSNTTAGVKTFYVERSEDDFLGIEFDALDLTITLNECTFYNLSSPAYLLSDCDGTSIKVADLSRSDGFTSWTTSNNTSQVQLDHEWNQANSCYFFQIYDTSVTGAELVDNGDFAAAGTWIFGGNWALDGGEGVHTGAAPSTMSQDIGVNNFTIYRVDFTVDAFDDFGSAATLTIKVGGITVKVLSDLGDTDGTYHIMHRVNTKTNDLIEFIISTAANFECTVDNVSVKAVAGEAATALGCSECFEVASWLDVRGCEITRLLTATNDDNGFGFDYTNFTMVQSMRIKGRFKNDGFDQLEYDNFLKNNNTTTTVYAQSRRTRLMKFDMHPAYVYNAVQIMSDHDTFKIDDVQHSKITEGIQPTYPEGWRTGTVELVYYETSQPNRINDNC